MSIRKNSTIFIFVCLCGLTRGKKAKFRYLFSKGTRYGILAARNYAGVMAWKILDVNANTREFIDFIIAEVVPKMNPYPGPNSVLVLDGASYHKSDAFRRINGKIWNKSDILASLFTVFKSN